jgi:lysophospholipase L1-like esterase
MKKLAFILFFLTAFITLKAQDAPFYKEIQNFKKQDSINFPPKNAVLFIGSSTFTKWTDVQRYFPKHVIINRGFGGSSLPHLINYVGDSVYPYQPTQVVIYCGENDFGDPNVTPQIVVDRVKKLIELIRAKYPKVEIAYISIKPSPSREKWLTKIKETNKMLVEVISKMKRTTFINTFDAMLSPDGTVMKDIFLSDNLHMNAKGYAIWQGVMERYLK